MPRPKSPCRPHCNIMAQGSAIAIRGSSAKSRLCVPFWNHRLFRCTAPLMEQSAPKPVVETVETGGVNVKVVVVSNRVARAQPDEPIAGGLAAALIPMVKESGAIWVGSSGQVGDPTNKESFAKIEALGAGAL